MIVLDTNVVSEPLRVEPDEGVLTWLRSRPDACITSVTVGELLSGVRMLPEGRRRSRLLEAVESALAARSGRVLPYDAGAARIFAELREQRQRKGRPLTTEDGMIAAICRLHGAAIATRNERDFDLLGVEIVNPLHTS